MIFICSNLLDASSLADDRANDSASATSYRCLLRGLTSSNGRWTSPLRCLRKRSGNEIAARDRERKQRYKRAALRTRNNRFAIESSFQPQLSLFSLNCLFFLRFFGQNADAVVLRQNATKVWRPAHERFVRYPKRQWWCDGIHHHSLERGIGGARRNARCTESTRNTLSHLLATSLRLCSATRPWTRRSAGSRPGIFRAPARTQKSRHGPAREGTFAFLPACLA